jgi:hypothetical protein
MAGSDCSGATTHSCVSTFESSFLSLSLFSLRSFFTTRLVVRRERLLLELLLLLLFGSDLSTKIDFDVDGLGGAVSYVLMMNGACQQNSKQDNGFIFLNLSDERHSDVTHENQ